MSSEPLNIHDKVFLINRIIQQAPKNTVFREFFKNAEENASLAASEKREVRIYPTRIDGVDKLTFWNTGVGMSDTELRLATEISSSINKELDIDQNFGIGAKVSGLAVSPFGIRYRSCKNGIVSQVTIGFEEELQQYCRLGVQLDDQSVHTVIDVTESVENDLSYDWTEVVLLGQSEDHNTVTEPLLQGDVTERSFIPSEIYRRFSEFEEGVSLFVDVAMTKGGGVKETGRFRRINSLVSILGKLPNHELVLDSETGVAVRYIYDPKVQNTGHTTSAGSNPAVSSTTFCALVHKRERYDFKTRQAWSSKIRSWGTFSRAFIVRDAFAPCGATLSFLPDA